MCLFVLDNTNLGGAQHSTVELEALLLDEEDCAVFLVRLGSHESSLLLVGVELLALGAEALEAVLLEGVHKNILSHLEALIQVGEILKVLGSVLCIELLLGDHSKGAVEVVNAVDEVLGELLDCKVFRRLDLTGGSLLEVAEISDGAQALVLEKSQYYLGRFCFQVVTNLPVLDFGFLGSEILLGLGEGIIFVLSSLLFRLGLVLRFGLLGRLGFGLLSVAVPSRHGRLGRSEGEGGRGLELRLYERSGGGGLGSSPQCAGRGGNRLAEHCEVYEEVN